MGLSLQWLEQSEGWFLATGIQFLGKESNSHYHLHIYIPADVSFKGTDCTTPNACEIALQSLLPLWYSASKWCCGAVWFNYPELSFTAMLMHKL